MNRLESHSGHERMERIQRYFGTEDPHPPSKMKFDNKYTFDKVTDVYYGGVGDLWETVLAPGDVNRPDFGVTVTVGGYQWPAVNLVDDVRIGVYYDGP